MNHGLIPYIGGKHRLAKRLIEICRGTGADTLVDVFGGSAAIAMAGVAVFGKVIYNDLDGDLVNVFRGVADNRSRVKLFRALRWLPPIGTSLLHHGFALALLLDSLRVESLAAPQDEPAAALRQPAKMTRRRRAAVSATLRSEPA